MGHVRNPQRRGVIAAEVALGEGSAGVSLGDGSAGVSLGDGSAGVSLGDGGRYGLEYLLGTGTTASVWLATDNRLERRVAVKVLSGTLAADPDHVQRFLREAKLGARLSHRHLVSIYDYSAGAGRPYLVLELVDGGTLADRLEGSESASVDTDALAWEVLSALAYIHGAGAVHREVTASNVLIGRDGRTRLTHVGVPQLSDARSVARADLFAGTQRHLAPELCFGEPADRRSDLYACGILLGECPRLGMSAELSDLISDLTEGDPRRRPQSAEAALARLGADRDRTARRAVRFDAGYESPARPQPKPASPSSERVGGPGRVHVSPMAATAIAAIAAVAIAVLVLILATYSGTSTPVPQLSSPAPTRLRTRLSDLDRGSNQTLQTRAHASSGPAT